MIGIRRAFAPFFFLAAVTLAFGCGKGKKATGAGSGSSGGPNAVAAIEGEAVFEYRQDDSLANVAEFTSAKVQPAKAGGPAKVAPPMTLTCSDGSGLELRALTARTVVDGPLAFTELHLDFHNPQHRTREGRFAITLPPKAAISRFAMKIRGEWMEGEVVEKQRARRIYEDFLHRKQDPAILEQDAGNTFRARVFPILPNADKQLIISFSQELPSADTPITLPLRGLGKLQTLQLAAFVQTGKPGKKGRVVSYASLERKAYTPSVDFVVQPKRVGRDVDSLRHSNLALARVVAKGAAADEGFERVVLLFDTSASQAIAFDKRLERLSALVAFLGKQGARHVDVVAFDQERVDVFSGKPSTFGDKELASLRKRAALGGSDLSAALNHAARLLIDKKVGGKARVVVFGNGVATLGEREADGLRKIADKLRKASVQRLDTVTMTTARDNGSAARDRHRRAAPRRRAHPAGGRRG